MKTVSLLAPLLLLCITGFSQDTLYINDGRKINGKVAEIRSDMIRYKSPTDGTSQFSMIALSNVNSIHYQNGSSDLFQVMPIQSDTTSNSTLVINNYNTANPNSPVNQHIIYPNNTVITNDIYTTPVNSNVNTNRSANIVQGAAVGIRLLGLIASIAVDIADKNHCHNNNTNSYTHSNNSNNNNWNTSGNNHWRGH